jgi:hypothetical protein
MKAIGPGLLGAGICALMPARCFHAARLCVNKAYFSEIDLYQAELQKIACLHCTRRG